MSENEAGTALWRVFPWRGSIRRRRETLGLFARRLATLSSAGMPLLRALELLHRQEHNPRFRRILGSLAGEVRAGVTLSKGLRRHRNIFDPIFVNMVHAAESGGDMAPVLDRLASILEQENQTRRRVRAALFYPAVVIIVAGAVVALLLGLVVPQFELIFAELLRGVELPALTRRIVVVSHLVQARPLLLVSIASSIGLLGWALRRTPSGGLLYDRLALMLPGVRTLVRKAAIARLCRILGNLLSSGTPILEAIRIARGVTGNHVIETAITRVHDSVREGDGLAAPMAREPVFPEMLTGMIAVGEESGSLEVMLSRIADHYDADVDHAIRALTALVEPVMIVVLALVVGTIVIALFLPIITIIQGLAG